MLKKEICCKIVNADNHNAASSYTLNRLAKQLWHCIHPGAAHSVGLSAVVSLVNHHFNLTVIKLAYFLG